MPELLPLRRPADPPAAPPAARPLLTVRETAALLRVSQKTLWSLTKNGDLAAVRIGKAVRYDPRDVEAFIAGAKS